MAEPVSAGCLGPKNSELHTNSTTVKEDIQDPYDVVYEDKYVLKIQWDQNFDQEPNKGTKKSLKDKLMSVKKGILIIEGKTSGDGGIFLPSDAIMILSKDTTLSAFRSLAVEKFKALNFIVDFSTISGGESISLLGSISDPKSTAPTKLTINLYNKLKKVMVQGTTSPLEVWIQKYYEIAKDIALVKDLTPAQNLIVANSLAKSVVVPSNLKEQEINQRPEIKERFKQLL